MNIYIHSQPLIVRGTIFENSIEILWTSIFLIRIQLLGTIRIVFEAINLESAETKIWNEILFPKSFRLTNTITAARAPNVFRKQCIPLYFNVSTSFWMEINWNSVSFSFATSFLSFLAYLFQSAPDFFFRLTWTHFYGKSLVLTKSNKGAHSFFGTCCKYNVIDLNIPIVNWCEINLNTDTFQGDIFNVCPACHYIPSMYTIYSDYFNCV